MESSSPQPSMSSNPDLDWSQIRETVRMLNLAVAHIEMSMRDGDESVDTLSGAFTTMMGNLKAMGSIVAQQQESESKDTFMSHYQIVEQQMQSTIVAFQFYDKLSQRLSHVSHSISALGDLISHQEKLYNPSEWKVLQEKIRSKYSIESDKKMFEALLGGATVAEALEFMKNENKDDSEDDAVELF
jgi:uncharacterized protein YukE